VGNGGIYSDIVHLFKVLGSLGLGGKLSIFFLFRHKGKEKQPAGVRGARFQLSNSLYSEVFLFDLKQLFLFLLFLWGEKGERPFWQVD